MKSPPITEDGVIFIFAGLVILLGYAAFPLAWGLFQFALAVLSPLWETIGHWWGAVTGA